MADQIFFAKLTILPYFSYLAIFAIFQYTLQSYYLRDFINTRNFVTKIRDMASPLKQMFLQKMRRNIFFLHFIQFIRVTVHFNIFICIFKVILSFLNIHPRILEKWMFGLFRRICHGGNWHCCRNCAIFCHFLTIL